MSNNTKNIKEKYERVRVKAQQYWNSLSENQREKELERVLQGIRAGKYWGCVAGREHVASGNAGNETY